MAGINILIQYVNDPRPERQAEYDECLRRNLNNPQVKAVHDLHESDAVVVPEEFTRHPKFRSFEYGKWLTYRGAFEHANSLLPNQIFCLLNLDIFLDPRVDWSQAEPYLNRRVVFCLSRTEFRADGTSYRDPALNAVAFANSQDAWLFQTPISVDNCDFELGTLGCDNAIAHRIKQAGYHPVNAPQRFRVFHYDQARGKTLGNQQRVYYGERTGRGRGSHPERQGWYLLPDIDSITSVDQLLRTIQAGEIDRYAVICDVFQRFVQLQNVEEPPAGSG